jgi:hypothetical protein
VFNIRPDWHEPEPRAAADASGVAKDARGRSLTNEQRLEAERRKLREREQLIANLGDSDTSATARTRLNSWNGSMSCGGSATV